MKQKTEYQDIRPNRTHKADVFAMAFKNKKDLLDLYNAVNGTNKSFNFLTLSKAMMAA